MRHRGPDGSGTFVDRDAAVALGHARLSIIDLQTGGQPLYSETGDVVLVCNGEIYDFERLRDELMALGHVFRTRSDSEVIIHLYQQHGLRFVEQLRGEFAFLLYDRSSGRLLAVRDRFGIKPLLYSDKGGRLMFASEAKAMMATGFLEPRLSVEAVRDYLSMVIPDSMFEGVETVPPGSMLVVDTATLARRIERYWDCDLPAAGDDGEETDFGNCLKTVRELFDEAVRLRLKADVPVGVYLSGGIDSAIVAATVAKYHDDKVLAFNISFPEDEAFDENRLAREMAASIGAEFHSVECGTDALLENTEDCIWVTELPFVNFHGVGKFMLSNLARKQVKVVLTGEGSDEVFLGYAFFQPGGGGLGAQISGGPDFDEPRKHAGESAVAGSLGFVPMPEHAGLLSRKTQKRIRRLFDSRHWRRLDARPALERLKARIDHAQTDGRPAARKMQYAWIKNMLAPYLLTILGDRAEMGHSIEGRTPFLDHVLFEAARRIPDRFKIRDGVEKHVLREAFKDRLTAGIYSRRKWPYSAPPVWIEKGKHAGLNRLIEKHLSLRAISRTGIFSCGRVTAWRWASRLLPFDSKFKRLLNSGLLLILTVQILDHMFVREFRENLNRRKPGAAGTNAG
jgi:asparagine synthase (glutamine-hydrolysing)